MHTTDIPLPRDKFDTDNATALTSLTWQQLGPHVPRILEWVQDANWPVARVLMPVLAAHGACLAPCLEPILAGADGAWKQAVLTGIVARSPALAAALHDTLRRLAEQPAPDDVAEEVNLAAQAILAA